MSVCFSVLNSKRASLNTGSFLGGILNLFFSSFCYGSFSLENRTRRIGKPACEITERNHYQDNDYGNYNSHFSLLLFATHRIWLYPVFA